jgi:HSP20 family protein
MKLMRRHQDSWNPFREMDEIQNRLSSLINGSTRSSFFGGKSGELLTAAEWSPVVDISEEDHEYVISAELPELKKEDVSVTLENGVLTISGERKFEKEQKKRRFHRVERGYGKFVRSFTLPGDVNPDKVNAEFKDGVLRVRVAKDENAKPKAIEVKAG